jgi:ATP-dependent exoDNAse (exonuclease V) beta subunit
LLLREHGLELGIDPSFTILDEQRSADLARECAIETLRHEIKGGNEAAETLFGDFGREKLVETIVSAGYWLNSLGVGREWVDSRLHAQRRAATSLETVLRNEILDYGGFEGIGAIADDVEARKKKHPLRKRDDAGALLPRIGQIAGVAAAERLVHLVFLAASRFDSRKRALNALDFDDLLLGARNLLKQSASIRTHYNNHFQALLLDEFQDTDEVQAEIVRLLAEHPDDPNRFAEGKLLIVGDPKQSIYRFRRARVTVFFSTLRRIRDSGGLIEHLQENHRSAPGLAEFSNRLSQSMMDGMGRTPLTEPGLDLSYRIRFSADDVLIPKGNAPLLGITYIAAQVGAKAAAGREMEAEAVARLLRKWKSDGTIQSWKEVALLLRVMSNVEVYLGALEAHRIPVYVVQGALFYQKSEVSDLIALLELILHPNDSLLRATVLSSSLAALTFRDLLEGRGSAELDEILRPWIEERDRSTAAEILQDVIRRTNFDVVMMAQKNGRQKVANIGKLIEITRELARQGTTALDEVVRHLRDRVRDTAVREPEAQIVGQDDDVVRILTVHQAKGLEFDVVIVPELAARTARSAGDRTLFSDRWGLLAGAAYGLHRKALPHSLILQSRELDEDQQYEEEKRLLYVAVTRAKKMLVLGEGFSKQTGPWQQWIQRLFDNVQPGALEKARNGKPASVRFKGRAGQVDFSVQLLPAALLAVPEQLSLIQDFPESDPGRTLAAMRDSQGKMSNSRVPVTSMLEMTPSDLTSLDGCFRRFHWTRVDGMTEPGQHWSADASLMRLGSVVHRILETGLRGPDGPDLSNVYASPEWHELTNAGPERELPFMMEISADGRKCTVRGRMDAVVIAGKLPRVVDYKYATWREYGDRSYEIQMTAYCLALMKALDADRAIGELWYLKDPMKIIRKEYTRAAAEQRLEQLLAQYFRALETGEWPAAERPYCDRVECGFRSRCWQ